MKKEKSCGCIIIKNKKVLLVYEDKHFFWGFPKGHMEDGETEIETAKREVLEEVGLKVKIEEDKRYEIHYKTKNEIEKTSVFYLAKIESGKVKKQESEIVDVCWCNYKEAQKKLTYENLKDVLQEVKTMLE